MKKLKKLFDCIDEDFFVKTCAICTVALLVATIIELGVVVWSWGLL